MSQRRNNTRPSIEEGIPNIEGAVRECVRYIICQEGSKIPIKRENLSNHLSTTCQTAKNHVNKVIVEANNTLKRVYGYKLVQVEAKGGVQYIVVLNEKCDSVPSSVVDSQQRKLLVAALMHIYMSGGPVKEEEMWKFLSEAGLLDENDHTGRKILTTKLTKQMYLSYTKEGGGDLARNVFEWGQRATEEVPKIFLLNKMAEAFQKNPDHWCEQYKEATQEVAS